MKVLIITGSAGTGKSTLSISVSEVLKHLRSEIISTDDIRQLLRIEKPDETEVHFPLSKMTEEQWFLQSNRVMNTVGKMIQFYQEKGRQLVIVEGINALQNPLKNIEELEVKSVFVNPKEGYTARLVSNNMEPKAGWVTIQEHLSKQDYDLVLDTDLSSTGISQIIQMIS